MLIVSTMSEEEKEAQLPEMLIFCDFLDCLHNDNDDDDDRKVFSFFGGLLQLRICFP
jgi:hypothetical protein